MKNTKTNDTILLYHGCAASDVASIKQKGLLGVQRGRGHAIHFSRYRSVAAMAAIGNAPWSAGKRKGVVLVLCIPRKLVGRAPNDPDYLRPENYKRPFLRQSNGEFGIVTADKHVCATWIVAIEKP